MAEALFGDQLLFKERAYGPVRAKPFMLGWFDCFEEVKWEIN